jgi:signal transduction histidine kinase
MTVYTLPPSVMEDAERHQLPLPDLAERLIHKLRNPLSVITTAASQLEESACDRLDPDETYLLRALVTAADRLDEILDDFDVYTSPSLSEQDRVNLNDICRAELKNIASEFDNIEQEFGSARPKIEIIHDQHYLRKVISNIISNAFQSIKGEGKVTVETSQLNGMACVKVIDNGEGISSDHIDDIYRPFFTTRPGRTGLGLTVADKLVRVIGGKLEMAASFNGGTVVTIHLPVRHQDKE